MTEMETYTRIYLSDNEQWGGSNVNFNIHSMREMIRSIPDNIFSPSTINSTGDEMIITICSVRQVTPLSSPYVTVSNTNSEFDVAIVNISTALSQLSSNNSLLGNVIIRDTVPLKVSDASSNERYYNITADNIVALTYTDDQD